MDKQEKINELMNAKKPVTLGLIARELDCSDLEAAQALKIVPLSKISICLMTFGLK